jgi:hypothetical protein
VRSGEFAAAGAAARLAGAAHGALAGGLDGGVRGEHLCHFAFDELHHAIDGLRRPGATTGSNQLDLHNSRNGNKKLVELGVSTALVSRTAQLRAQRAEI